MNNIVSIERQISEVLPQAAIELLTFCVFNAKSINNKTGLIKDHVLDNKIDMLALTETWLRSADDNNFVTRDKKNYMPRWICFHPHTEINWALWWSWHLV